MSEQLLQRPFPLHRQFRPLDHRRGDPQPGGRRDASRPIAPAAIQKAPSILRHSLCSKRLNYDVSNFRSKPWDEFAQPGAPKLDFVFTVCDDAAGEACPVWPGQPMTAHWGIPDPARATGTDAEIAFAFSDAYRLLFQRITTFVALPIASLDRMVLARSSARSADGDGATQKAKEQK